MDSSESGVLQGIFRVPEGGYHKGQNNVLMSLTGCTCVGQMKVMTKPLFKK